MWTTARTSEAARLGVGLFGVLSVLFFCWSGSAFYESHSGPTVHVTVDRCETHGTGRQEYTTCTGHWVENGRRVTGPVKNVDALDEGRTVTAHVHDGIPVAESVSGPIIPAVVGAFFLLAAGGCVLVVTGTSRWSRHPRP